jgi:cytochrome c oxidase cbb3-type subunit III
LTRAPQFEIKPYCKKKDVIFTTGCEVSLDESERIEVSSWKLINSWLALLVPVVAIFVFISIFGGGILQAGPFASPRQQDQQQQKRATSQAPSDRGGSIFAATCAGCHGLDGRGGERAPDIANSPKVQRLSDSQIFHIIENGIPGTGMPAFHSLGNSETKALVTYLRTLQGRRKLVKLPGNSERGRAIFFGNGGCSECHMVNGNGGFIASDLSRYAHTHAAEQTREAITNPGANGDRQVRLATATIRGGEKYLGRVRNEDNFSLQLQTLDGVFHLILKSDLEGLEYDTKALMPSDYGSTLRASELDDVVSYLVSVAEGSELKVPKKTEEQE